MSPTPDFKHGIINGNSLQNYSKWPKKQPVFRIYGKIRPQILP